MTDTASPENARHDPNDLDLTIRLRPSDGVRYEARTSIEAEGRAAV